MMGDFLSLSFRLLSFISFLPSPFPFEGSGSLVDTLDVNVGRCSYCPADVSPNAAGHLASPRESREMQ
jgi:hypothetical protein